MCMCWPVVKTLSEVHLGVWLLIMRVWLHLALADGVRYELLHVLPGVAMVSGGAVKQHVCVLYFLLTWSGMTEDGDVAYGG